MSRRLKFDIPGIDWRVRPDEIRELGPEKLYAPELAPPLRLVVDVDGFKARREQSLRRLARRMAEQAARTGHTAVLEPMSPYERRIVHIALREHPQVTTQSVGEGDRRKVTIIPRH